MGCRHAGPVVGGARPSRLERDGQLAIPLHGHNKWALIGTWDIRSDGRRGTRRDLHRGPQADGWPTGGPQRSGAAAADQAEQLGVAPEHRLGDIGVQAVNLPRVPARWCGAARL
jgi:hypothetical protein